MAPLASFVRRQRQIVPLEVKLQDVDQIAAYYADQDIVGVLLAWDAETATGRKPLATTLSPRSCDAILSSSSASPASIPTKASAPSPEIERAIQELGLPARSSIPASKHSIPATAIPPPLRQDRRALGIPALFHTGTNGLGAGMPGGGGIKLDYTRPIYLDSLAADLPDLTIIGAHPSWPWEQEMIAILQHKPNVYNDLSGWSPGISPSAAEGGRRTAQPQVPLRLGLPLHPAGPLARRLREARGLDARGARECPLAQRAEAGLSHTPVAQMQFS